MYQTYYIYNMYYIYNSPELIVKNTDSSSISSSFTLSGMSSEICIFKNIIGTNASIAVTLLGEIPGWWRNTFWKSIQQMYDLVLNYLTSHFPNPQKTHNNRNI